MYALIIAQDELAAIRRREEFRLMNLLKRLPSNIGSKVPAVYPELDIIGYPSFIMDHVKGITIEGNHKKTGPATRKAIKFIEELHIETRIDNRELFESNINDLFEHSINRFRPFRNIISNINQRISQTLPEQCTYCVWQHGDYKLENIIFTSKDLEINGVIDWELSVEK